MNLMQTSSTVLTGISANSGNSVSTVQWRGARSEWAETPREKAWVLAQLQEIPRRFGVTPDLVARHVLAVNRTDGARQLATQYQARRRAERKLKN